MRFCRMFPGPLSSEHTVTRLPVTGSLVHSCGSAHPRAVAFGKSEQGEGLRHRTVSLPQLSRRDFRPRDAHTKRIGTETLGEEAVSKHTEAIFPQPNQAALKTNPFFSSSLLGMGGGGGGAGLPLLETDHRKPWPGPAHAGLPPRSDTDQEGPLPSSTLLNINTNCTRCEFHT